MLLALIVIPLLAAIFVPLLPKRMVRPVALLGTLAPLALCTWMLFTHGFLAGERVGLETVLPWFPELGLSFKLNADGVSMALIALTTLLGPICVLASYTAITSRVRTYYGWLLMLQAAMTGVFAAQDLILFYIFFEFTLVPMFVLISLFGSTNRKAAAVKFFLYTFTGSIIALAGIVYVAWFHASQGGAVAAVGGGGWDFDIATLRAAAQRMSAVEQNWVFAALMLGFAVKVPLFPLHTWLPLAHTEAPTAGSVVLAGVLLKLGTYAIYTFAIPFVPMAAIAHAPLIGVLACIGILAMGLVCWVQRDVKKLVAYSSVAHLGFCMLGLFSFNAAGLQGALLYMINHGLSTGALFLLIGMMYERYHTRDMTEIGGLAARMPVWSTFMVFFAMASVGLPGLNGFVSEFLCLLGTFQAWNDWAGLPAGAAATGGELGPWFALAAGAGMVVAAMYILAMVGKVVWGPLKEPGGHGHGGGGHAGGGHAGGHAGGHGSGHAGGGHDAGAAGGDEAGLPVDLGAREIGILTPLAILCVVLGLYPKPLMDMMEDSVIQTQTLMAETRARMKGPAAAPAAAAAAEPGGATPLAGLGDGAPASVAASMEARP